MKKRPEMSRATMLMAVGLLVSVVACVIFAYLLIDRSISLSYLEASQRSTQHGYTQLAALVEHEWFGLAESEVLRRLQAEAARHPHRMIVVKRDSSANVIWFDDVRFEFESGGLIRVR